MMDGINTFSLWPPTVSQYVQFMCFSEWHYFYSDVKGDTHLSWWISCSSPLPFLQVHFIFISTKLERVNSIPRRLWLRLGTFTVSLFLSLALSFFCSCNLLSLSSSFLFVSKV